MESVNSVLMPGQTARDNGKLGGRPKGSKTAATRVKEAASIARLLEVGVTAQNVIDELARVGFSNVAQFFDEHGNLKSITQLERDHSAAIASFEVLKKNAEAGDGKIDVIHKARLWDKIKALELIGKHLRLFDDRLQVSGSVDLVTTLQSARVRLAKHRETGT